MTVMTNQELAKRFCDNLKAHNNFIRYEPRTNLFWRYDDYHWHIWPIEEMRQEFVFFADKIINLSKSKIDEVTGMCRYYAEKTDDSSDEYVSFNDVMWNACTFDLAAPSPKLMATVRVRCEYSELGKTRMPMFRKYLDDVCAGNSGMEEQLQEIMGYALTPEMTEKFFIFYGDGGTGKSVFLTLLSKMVAPTRCSYSSIERLTTKDFALDVLIGKRLNIVHEEQSLNSNVAFLKELVSGNPMDIRKLYSDTRTFVPKVKFFFGSNRFPRLDGFDRALERRMMIIPFTNWIEEKDRILHIEELIIKDELPALFAWAMDGLKRLKANKWAFTETEASKETLREFAHANSSINEYLDENWENDPLAETSVDMIYNDYVIWCNKTGRHPLSKNRMAREGATVIGKSKSVRLNGKVVRVYPVSPKKNDL